MLHIKVPNLKFEYGVSVKPVCCVKEQEVLITAHCVDTSAKSGQIYSANFALTV